MLNERPTTTLRAFLVAAGITQVDLAAAISTSPVYLNGVVNGHRRPGPAFRAAVAEVLEVDEDLLFADID